MLAPVSKASGRILKGEPMNRQCMTILGVGLLAVAWACAVDCRGEAAAPDKSAAVEPAAAAPAPTPTAAAPTPTPTSAAPAPTATAASEGAQPKAMPTSTSESPPIKTPKEAMGYSLGVGAAQNLKHLGVDVDADAMIRGIRDVYAGSKLALSEEDLQAAAREFQNEILKKQAEAAAAAGDANRKEGDAFLAANKTKEGVVVLPSGLQYKIIKAGDGKKPAETDTVEVNYRGTLINGTEFDSSFKRGVPATFKVNQVIPGWVEALKLMPVGSKWQLFVPSDLAYGPRAMGPLIGPNSTLIFEVELLSVK